MSFNNQKDTPTCKKCGAIATLGHRIDTTGITPEGEIIHGLVKDVVLSNCYKCAKCGHSFLLDRPTQK